MYFKLLKGLKCLEPLERVPLRERMERRLEQKFFG
jgi:hypothetical protein